MIRALAIYSDNSGCDYHRVKLPFQYGGQYVDHAAFKPANGDLNKLLDISELVLVNRDCPLPGVDLSAIKKKGVKVVLDLDDHWELNPGHYMTEYYRSQRVPEKISRNIRLADVVTVTTSRLAEKVKPLNKNVHVIPNAIPYGHGQFKDREYQPFEIFNVLYAGQKSHLHDLGLIGETMKRFAEENPLDLCFVLAGYQSGDKEWEGMEGVFTAGGKLKNYYRIPNAPLDKYMSVYEAADAVLVPLLNNSFNRHKSNLKLLEAAAQKIPVICQRVPPYSDTSDAPVLWVESPGDWYRHIKYLSANREAAKEMGQSLHEWAVKYYNLITWNKTRFELYESIVNS
ncbi:glycosyltransferase [Chitinophaga niabensis]|uniref:glycosyltransferase family protein n=1 Tax=Chitinophaga niabensis TaxID=536979 RepID=UPI0031BA1D03